MVTLETQAFLKILFPPLERWYEKMFGSFKDGETPYTGVKFRGDESITQQWSIQQFKARIVIS